MAQGRHASTAYDKVHWLVTRPHLWKDARRCACEMIHAGLYARTTHPEEIYRTMWKWWELARQVQTGERALESLRAKRPQSYGE